MVATSSRVIREEDSLMESGHACPVAGEIVLIRAMSRIAVAEDVPAESEVEAAIPHRLTIKMAEVGC